MRNYSKIAAAVAVALGSGSVLAANPTWTDTLNIAGSSALRDAVSNELSTVLCTAGTFTAFTAAKGAGGSFDSPDFRAFTCTLKAALPAPLGGTAVIVYYRSEGGSIFGVFGNSAFNSPGPGGVGGSLQINRLNIGPSGGTECADSGAVVLGVTQPTAANVEADNQQTLNSSCVVKDTVQLGFSDVEPAAFVGTNYGSEYTFINYPQPTVTQLNSLSKGTMIGQAFGAIVSNAGGTSGFANASGFSTAGLTSQELATIFSGNTTDWSNVPSAKAVGATAPAPITVCRREPGSGTQTIASTHFLHTNCGATGGGLPFVSVSKAGLTVNEGFATSDVLSCVQGNAGAIGIVTLQTAAKITGAAATQINVDGVQGNATNAAQGSYPWYGEAYFVKNPGTTNAFQTALVTRFITDMQSAANVPTNAVDPNLVALPSTNVPFSPVTPLKAGQQIPIAIGTTGGSTCTPLTDVIG
jgi:ABC-type phosphate transport system substrate-binding protein